MSLINYKDIDFKSTINRTNKIINFNGVEIQILNYLSSIEHDILLLNDKDNCVDRDLFE